MLEETQEKPMETKTNSADSPIMASLAASALEGATTALMMVDRDLVIRYANKGTVVLIAKHEAEFKATFPGFSADKLIGTCIDIFHKRPEHQRTMLANPKNLPHTAEIRVGRLAFQISITALHDASGQHVGSFLEWIDITAQLLKAADAAGQIAAIGKSQAVIEFDMDGKVVTANENFLNALGYRLDEIQGKHHSMFVDQTYARTEEYRQFWLDLNQGRFNAGEYQRFGKAGKEVWIQASYNPILNLQGKAFKVVKYATDTTAQKKVQQETERLVNETQRVIEAWPKAI